MLEYVIPICELDKMSWIKRLKLSCLGNFTTTDHTNADDT